MKILIVDDETPIREWIQFTIERDGNPEFEIAALAENGNEAYELAMRHQPAVVITDIKMPGMDGIELMKRVLKVSPYTYFIILTNYAEFSYAREAVTYGAKKYLLKSELRGRDILGALNEIRKELLEKLESKEKDRYSNGYLDIFDCYYNLNHEGFLEEFWKRHHFRPDEYFLVTAFEKREEDRQKELFDSFVLNWQIHAIGPALKNKSIYLILQAKDEKVLAAQADDLSELYRREKNQGYLRLYDVLELQPLDRAAIKKECQTFLGGILDKGEEELQTALKDWFHSLHGASFADIQWVKEICVQVIIRIEEICAEHILDFKEERQPDMDLTLTTCERLCQKLISLIYSGDHFRYSQSVREAMRYIHDNYCKEISLNEVARYTYRSPEYLSRLFKAETGENFSSYLTAFRLNKARDMLLNTDMLIYEIAGAVGYATPSHFSKMYKEFTGVRPEITRNRKKREEKKSK